MMMMMKSPRWRKAKVMKICDVVICLKFASAVRTALVHVVLLTNTLTPIKGLKANLLGGGTEYKIKVC